MNKLLLLTCLIYISINANYIVINNSGHYLIFDEDWHFVQYLCRQNRSSVYLLSPGERREIITNQNFPHFFSVRYFKQDLDKEAFEKEKREIKPNILFSSLDKSLDWHSNFFKIPDDEYGEILNKGKEHLPIITIRHSQNVDKPYLSNPVIDAPQTTKDLLAQIEQIKKEKIAAATEQVHEGTGLPNKEGSLAGLIARLAAEEE